MTGPRIAIIGDSPGISALAEGTPFGGWGKSTIESLALRAGIHPTEVHWDNLRTIKGAPTEADIDSTFKRLNAIETIRCIIPLGERALNAVTNRKAIDKWQLSPLDCVESLKCRKAVPTFDLKRLGKDFSLHVYIIKSIQRAIAAAELPGPWQRKPKDFLLNPDFETTMDVLHELRARDTLAVDIETGNGIINTMGFAWSESNAIAINVLPERLSAEKYHMLWRGIASLLEGDKRCIFQNLTYESMYLSRYGIRIGNYWHDTMWAQKMLWPEFEMGLANVGRLYTNEPYWKDTGKEYKSESGKRDWGNIKDWPEHYRYNCLDTSGTFEAAIKQRTDMASRGILPFFANYLMRLSNPIAEMCARGLPINEATRADLHEKTTSELRDLKSGLSEPINPNSSKQKLELLKAKGYKMPKKRDSKTGKSRESADELSLKKLRLKHPEDKDIELLLKIAKQQKALSSYIDITYDDDQNLRYAINGTGTETLRFSSSKDPWDRGLNAQTLPKRYKSMFDAPAGKTWVQIDLAQAESRFVAYDSCDETLITMLEDPSQDIHRYVAAAIFECSEDQVQAEKESGDPSKRQLGKKSGHGANYSMGWNTFAESCLKEMDLVLDKRMATKVLETYHRLFPGIRRWHADIRKTLYAKRKLSNPLGFERYFYGRLDDSTYREAYAFKPQSTIPMITNYLMLQLLDQRKVGLLDFSLHLQCHDSILLMCDDTPDKLLPIVEATRNPDSWHPEIILPAGKLVIPADVELGSNLGNLKEYTP